jgi:hypothetical protein
MPADPIHPDQLHGEARFRADLAAYLDSLPIRELAELLGELPRSRQEPLGLGVLMIALNERLPDAYKLLLPAGHPGLGEGRRRSLRQVVAGRRAARAAQHAGPPPSGLVEWLAERQRHVDQHAERARAGAVGEWRVAEALQARASDPDPTAGRQEPGDPPTEPAEQERDRQEQKRQRQAEDDLSVSWHTYRERTDHIRQTYGWTVPQPPPRAEPWLPLGRDDDQSATHSSPHPYGTAQGGQTLPSGDDRGGHYRQSGRAGGRSVRDTPAAVAGVRCARSSGTCGCPEVVRCPRRRTLVSAHPTPTPARWPRQASKPCCFQHAGRNCRSRRADGRSVRRMSAVAGLSAVLSTAGCGGVRHGQPDGCRSARCPRCRWTAASVRTALSTADTAAVCGCPRYRKRSPGRRPLVGCSHRRYAWPTWRRSRWLSCSRM